MNIVMYIYIWATSNINVIYLLPISSWHFVHEKMFKITDIREIQVNITWDVISHLLE